MRVTPKINDIPTETRNRNIPTLRPLITWTVMSGPLVIQGKRPVRASTPAAGRYFFFSAAAARSLATSSQLLMRSLPWVSSMLARTGRPCAFILTTPTHWGGMACMSQPRMMTLPHGKSIS